jgi:hypothetical protein
MLTLFEFHHTTSQFQWSYNMEQSTGGAIGNCLISKKPFPDESNREGIERMLLHAFEFALESGLFTAEGLLPKQACGIRKTNMDNTCPIHGVDDGCELTNTDIFRCAICHLLSYPDVEETDEQGRPICQKCAAEREADDGWHDPRS